MKTAHTILTFFFAGIMILAGFMHFIKPHAYDGFIPDIMPKVFVNYITGVIEILIGAGMLTKRYRKEATLALLVLMIAFLPLHTIDLFKAQPAIGSHLLVVIRFPIQFILIALAWLIHVNSY